MRTTEYSEYTENKRVTNEAAFTQKVSSPYPIIFSFSVYSVYSVVSHLPF